MKPIVKIGDELLRLKRGDPDRWYEFTVNETYLELIYEFPNDYRKLDGSNLDFEVIL